VTSPVRLRRREARARVVRVRPEGVRALRDDLACEEPLQIRLRAGGELRPLALTMRTPGNDFELAAGLLLSEGVIAGRSDVVRIGYCRDGDEAQRYNAVTVTLARATMPDLESAARLGTMTSACGLCGRLALDDLEARGVARVVSELTMTAATLAALPQRLRVAQKLFDRSGGLHAAALFTAGGELLALREDIGRHNAVDKLLGRALLDGDLPLGGAALMLSGRSGYELLHKAAIAGIPLVASVSAPSSLAVALAERFGITLAGFVRGGGFNLYSHPQRVELPASGVPV
jgi:FdhD protein